jgi:TRAP-type C4-dicarboxylate transport system permease small subunit
VIDRIERGILIVMTALLAVVTVGVFVQVVLRYTLAWSFLWGEELAVYSFVWCVFLGGVVNVHRRTNFAFEAAGALVPPPLRRLHRLLIDLVILGCCAFIAWQGWLYALLSVKRMSPALGFSLFVPTLAVPVCALLMCLVALRQLWLEARTIRSGAMTE